jgi:Ni,Fe-hydrogenase I cytochrome b subunit
MLSAISVVVVFLSGLFIDIPVIQAICAQTIIAIVANHFLQTITFSSAMVLDARRIKVRHLTPVNFLLNIANNKTNRRIDWTVAAL